MPLKLVLRLACRPTTYRSRSRPFLLFRCLLCKTILPLQRLLPNPGKHRRRVRRKRNIAATIDDDDDALLNAAWSRPRRNATSSPTPCTPGLHREVHRVGLVCPRHPERHAIVARAMLDATDVRCLRCNILPALGEAWASCVPCGFLFCGKCVSTYKRGGDLGPAHLCCTAGSDA